LGAKLTVLHVDEISSMNVGDFIALEGLRRESRRRIEKHLKVLTKSHDLSRAQFEIAEGKSHEVIVEKTRQLGADLLVMGTHGEEGWKTLHLGSTTDKVLHMVEIPLLAIPDIGKKEPFRRRMKRILLAADLGYTTKETVSYAVDLAKFFDAELDVLNVAYPSDELFPGLGSFWAQADLSDLKAELEQKRVGALEKLLPPSAFRNLKVKLAVREGVPHEVIDQTARRRKIDLLVIGAQGQGKSGFGWIGATTQKVLRMGACATLIVK
jgi:nucleotide-binding universal stress UspA family protein